MRQIRAYVAILGIAAVLMVPSSVLAQSGGGDKVKYKKVTKIDFTEGLIEGDLMRPEGSYVVSRKASQFSKLIRVRQNFVRELVFSYSEL